MSRVERVPFSRLDLVRKRLRLMPREFCTAMCLDYSVFFRARQSGKVTLSVLDRALELEKYLSPKRRSERTLRAMERLHGDRFKQKDSSKNAVLIEKIRSIEIDALDLEDVT